jgi:hypothetical protein
MILPVFFSWVDDLTGMSHHKSAHTMIFVNDNFILVVLIIKVYKNELPFFAVCLKMWLQALHFCHPLENLLIIDNFQHLFNDTKKDVLDIFLWNRVFTSWLWIVKLKLYFFSHTSSSHLRDNLDIENLLFWQLCMVAHLFLQQLALFILKERMKIEYYLQTVSHVH